MTEQQNDYMIITIGGIVLARGFDDVYFFILELKFNTLFQEINCSPTDFDGLEEFFYFLKTFPKVNKGTNKENLQMLQCSYFNDKLKLSEDYVIFILDQDLELVDKVLLMFQIALLFFYSKNFFLIGRIFQFLKLLEDRIVALY
jgi:hypothetical protein